MRGEHFVNGAVSAIQGGSSPHARGAPRSGGGRTHTAGIIPACAGSTCQTGRSIWHKGDHPRMRGEHLQINADHLITRGSSPHARGALERHFIVGDDFGIIPACAGSTI